MYGAKHGMFKRFEGVFVEWDDISVEVVRKCAAMCCWNCCKRRTHQIKGKGKWEKLIELISSDIFSAQHHVVEAKACSDRSGVMFCTLPQVCSAVQNQDLTVIGDYCVGR